jgi:hypothetical protein
MTNFYRPLKKKNELTTDKLNTAIFKGTAGFSWFLGLTR